MNFFMLKFYLKVFTMSVFSKPLMDLIHVWYGDRYWSNIVRGTIPIQVNDLEVKAICLEFLYKCFMFSMSVFAKSSYI